MIRRTGREGKEGGGGGKWGWGEILSATGVMERVERSLTEREPSVTYRTGLKSLPSSSVGVGKKKKHPQYFFAIGRS